MKKSTMLFYLPLLLLFPALAYPQTTHIVDASDFQFTPSNLTVAVGDTVEWENQGGFHSVVADNSSFSSGAASSAAWSYKFVFTTAGSYPFYCSIHGGPNGQGMSGKIIVQSATGVSQSNIAPNKFELKQNYPNPFNPSTNISFSLPAPGHVKLALYNISGKEISTLINIDEGKGIYNFQFEAATINGGLPSGIYFYRLDARTSKGNYTQIKKMVLLK